jgi:hypothetical protein
VPLLEVAGLQIRHFIDAVNSLSLAEAERAKMAQESPGIGSPDFMAPLRRISYAAQYAICEVEVSNPRACKSWPDNSS